MHSLPEPQRGGTLDDLWRYINLRSRRQRRLFLVWLLAALRGRGPFAILFISGEQGSAKSGLARVARSLTDPNEVVDRSLPKDPRDLMISAANCWVLSFDNISFLPEWASDALCRLSTGSAFSTRELYTDSDEVLFKAKRPVVINGIPDVATAGDLLDRAALLNLPRIPARRRVDERTLWSEFAAHRPLLFGSMLDLLAAALRVEPSVHIDRLPRQADYATWGESVCRAMGEPAGTFLRSLRANRDEAATIVLESSTIAGAIMALLRDQPQWEGEADELLTLLPAFVEAGSGRGRHWPQSPRGMSGALRRIVPALRTRGIVVTFRRASNQDRRRLIMIRHADPRQAEPST